MHFEPKQRAQILYWVQSFFISGEKKKIIVCSLTASFDSDSGLDSNSDTYEGERVQLTS